METPLLPDLSAVVDEESQEPVWKFKGEERISVASAGGDGTVQAGLWEARARHGERETVYRFWASGGGKGGDGGEQRGAAAAAALPRPLRLHQLGPDVLSGSHFDEYVVDYGELVPGPPPAASFEKPTSCVGVEVEVEVGGEKVQAGRARRRRSARLASTAASVAPRLPCSGRGRRASSSSSPLSSPPPPLSALEENAAFVAEHDGARGGDAPLLSSSSSLLSSPPLPLSALVENAAFVAEHNGARGGDALLLSCPPSPSYRVRLNRFAALSDAEFAATYLQSESLAARRQRRKKEENEEGEEEDGAEDGEELLQKRKKKKKPFSAELPYSRKVPKGRVPSAVDWRSTGAVPQAVKDQSTCGSCWAFGTTAAIEGAAFLSSGVSLSASEQQFMDCSWDFGANSACGGGDADAALDWLVKERRGEFEVERNYQYIGAAGFCLRKQPEAPEDASSSLDSSPPSSSISSSSPSPPKVKGYAFVPAGDDEALIEAVYSRGPLQVSINAAAKGFRFYSSGVYDEPSCSPREEDLDHSVALVGYGTDGASGKDFWLVRNSWSSHWGDGGYVKIARTNGGCGVGTAAMYAVMEEEEEEEEEQLSIA